LKDARPKPHLRHPHPHPLPPPSKEDRAVESHETKIRLTGLLVMLAAILVGLGGVVWGVVNQMSSASVGIGPWIAGGLGVVIFIVGAVLFNLGQTSEE
jgi:hypothetical protein